MNTVRFWLAVSLSAGLHVVPLAVLAGPRWFATEPVTPPVLLEAWGDSDREGFDVDVVALKSGTWKQGDEHTPGGENGSATTTDPVVDDDLRTEAPAAVAAIPEPSLPLLMPAAPEPARVSEKPNEEPTTAGTDKKRVGAPGGADMPLGTATKGGTVGSLNGVKVKGWPTKTYPPKAERLELEGRPVVWLRISTTGDVVEVKLYKACKHEILNQAALDYARKIKCIPARQGDTPVESEGTLDVIYELPLRLR